MFPVGYGLQGLFLICALLPAARFLLPVIGVLLVMLIGSVAIIELGKVKLYQTQGVIRLSEKGVMINDLAIQAAELRQVKVKFNFPRGQGAGRNGVGDKGNRIAIYPTTSDVAVVATVLVEDRAQRDNLVTILKGWRKIGVEVSANGIDLV